MNAFPTFIKQYAGFILLLLISSLFLSNWNIEKWLEVEWLKWNRIKLTSTLPICILSTQSAEQSCYKEDFLKQSKSKTWFNYEIPYTKTFLTWMEECLILIFILHAGFSPSWETKQFVHDIQQQTHPSTEYQQFEKQFSKVFQTVWITFASANWKIYKYKYFHHSYSS